MPLTRTCHAHEQEYEDAHENEDVYEHDPEILRFDSSEKRSNI